MKLCTNTSETKPLLRNTIVLQMTSNIEYFQALRIQCQVALGDAKADTHYL